MWSLLQPRPCEHTLNKLNCVNCCKKHCNNEPVSNKYVDWNFNFLVDNTGVTALLNDPSKGVDSNQRIGDVFTNVRLLVKFWISAALPTPAFQLMRVIIFWDNGYNQSFEPPDKNAILEDGQVLAPYNWSNQDRFDIIYDRCFPIGLTYYNGPSPNTTVMTVAPVTYFEDLIIDLKGRQTTFASNGDVELVTGQLQVLVIGTNTSGVGLPQFDWSSRVIFTDK